MDYNGSVMKRVALFLIVAGAAVAMVACQGAVGKTGEPGPEGPPGPTPPAPPPENLAPQARTLTLDPVMLVEEGPPKTINVGDNFFDPDAAEGETLTLTDSGWDASFVTVTLTDGMLAVGPVAAGSTTITVTATDAGGLSALATIAVTVAPEGMMPPMPVEDSLPPSVPLIPGRQHVITGAELAAAFTEAEGESLTFAASGSDDRIIMVTQVGNEVTITALIAGDATVTITATDEDSLTAKHEIMVSVRATLEPKASDMTPAAVALSVGGTATTVDVSMYFVDPDVGDLMYKATSSDDTKADAAADGSMVTITPVAAGMATVTVTASNAHGSASQMISVTVAATPPTRVGSITDVTLMIGQARSVGLAEYFEAGAGGGAITSYAASAMPTDIVDATVLSATLLIEARAAGEATITVTATDADGETETQTFMVTVEAEEVVVPPAANMPPTLKAGMSLGPYKGVYNATSGSEIFDFHNIDLSKIFVDDRTPTALITYKVRVTSEDDGDDDTTNDDVIAVQGENWVSTSGDADECDADAENDRDTPLPNGTNFNSKIGVCYQAVGTATIEVIAVDSEGAESTHSVMFRSHSGNHVPTAAAVTTTVTDPQFIVDVDGVPVTTRLNIGDAPKKVIDNKKIGDFFADNDFLDTGTVGRGSDTLTFTVKHYYSTTDTTDENIPNGLAPGNTGLFDANGMMVTTTVPTEIMAGKEQTKVIVSPNTWTGGRDSKFTVTVEALMGSHTDPLQADAVAIIATDEFGRSAARVFHVRVNSTPKAEGAQASATPKGTPKKLGDATMSDDTTPKNLRDLGFLGTDADEDNATVNLVAENAGYFHDPDGDDLTCRIDESSGTTGDDPVVKISLDTTNQRTLTINPEKRGDASITISCADTVGSRSEKATLRVTVTNQSRSIQ